MKKCQPWKFFATKKAFVVNMSKFSVKCATLQASESNAFVVMPKDPISCQVRKKGSRLINTLFKYLSLIKGSFCAIFDDFLTIYNFVAILKEHFVPFLVHFFSFFGSILPCSYTRGPLFVPGKKKGQG